MRTVLLTLCFAVVFSWQQLASAQMQYPLSAAADESGAIYVADRYLPGVWKIEDGKLATFFEGSKKYRTPLNAVRCVVLDRSGALIAGDTATREVYRFDPSGFCGYPRRGASRSMWPMSKRRADWPAIPTTTCGSYRRAVKTKSSALHRTARSKP
jgi:hypothetical protein